MSIMLPTAFDNAGSLTDVMSSSLAALGVENMTNALALAPATSTIIVLVDGLGSHNLDQARGHARFLTHDRHRCSDLSTVFPSTTASALVSLMTGESPAAHGVVGYRVREPQSGELVNQLTELDRVSREWMPLPTLAERASIAAEVFVVGRAKFADSPMTRTAYRGATYVSSESLEDRAATAAALAATPGRVVVLYVSELDSAAHKFGVASVKWSDVLERVDAMVRELDRLSPPMCTVLVTADHGVLDVPSASHIVVDAEPLLKGISAIGGEPRCLQLYAEHGADIDRIMATWSAEFSNVAQFLRRDDVCAISEFAGSRVIEDSVAERMGDIFVLAAADVVFYDGRETNSAPRRMVGQHGGMSPVEMRIPLIELRSA